MVEKRDTVREEWMVVASGLREQSALVTGLYEQHEYEFRVSAVNINGQGPPLVSDHPTVARLPFDPPSAPGIPEILEIGTDFLLLSWSRPISDGGGRIRGFIVEKREVGTDLWQRCNQNPSPPNSLNVMGMIDGRKYEFRVFAVNDAGFSEPATRYSSFL